MFVKWLFWIPGLPPFVTSCFSSCPSDRGECILQGTAHLTSPNKDCLILGGSHLKDLQSVNWTCLWLHDLFSPVLWPRAFHPGILDSSHETRNMWSHSNHVMFTKCIQKRKRVFIHVYTWWVYHVCSDSVCPEDLLPTPEGQGCVCLLDWVSSAPRIVSGKGWTTSISSTCGLVGWGKRMPCIFQGLGMERALTLAPWPVDWQNGFDSRKSEFIWERQWWAEHQIKEDDAAWEQLAEATGKGTVRASGEEEHAWWMSRISVVELQELHVGSMAFDHNYVHIKCWRWQK